eukprot:1646032-Lingulodinium_polyedra.AAC.1
MVPVGTVFKGKSQDGWLLSLGSVGDVGVLAWPLETTKIKGKLTFSLAEPQGDLAQWLQWVFVFQHEDFLALPVEVASPLHILILQGGKSFTRGIGLVAGKPTGLLQYAAHRCFWRLPRTQIAKICRSEGVPVEPTSTLLELLKALVRKCLPDISTGELAAILSQRACQQGGPCLGDLPADVFHEAMKEGPDAKDFQEHMHR